MAQLIINEELEIEILTFERSLRKLENDIIMNSLGVQVTSDNFNDELVDSLKNYLYRGSINKIEIIYFTIHYFCCIFNASPFFQNNFINNNI